MKDASTTFGLVRRTDRSKQVVEELLMPADVIRNPMTETQVLRHLKEQTGTVYDNNHFY